MNATYKLSPEAMPKAWFNVIRESAKAAAGDRYDTVVKDNVEVPAVACRHDAQYRCRIWNGISPGKAATISSCDEHEHEHGKLGMDPKLKANTRQYKM